MPSPDTPPGEIGDQILDVINRADDADGLVNDFRNCFPWDLRTEVLTKGLAEKLIVARNSKPGHHFQSVDEVKDALQDQPGVIETITNIFEKPFVQIEEAYPILFFPIRLETRFKQTELQVRFYPDQLVISTHERRLTKDEKDAGSEFLRASNCKENDSPQIKLKKIAQSGQNPWRLLVNRFGSPRAAWIVKVFIENKVNEIRKETFDEKQWTGDALIHTLPDRFLVLCYRGNEIIYRKWGEQIKSPVKYVDLSLNQEKEDLFYGEAEWVRSFVEAEKRGMAVRINLEKEGKTAKEFDRIIALGIKCSKTEEALELAEASELLVEEWIETQRYTDGLEFIRYGTPTNNLREESSGYTESVENSDESFHALFASDAVPIARHLDQMHNAGKLDLAFGLSGSQGFGSIIGADRIEGKYNRAMNKALWPITGDYFLQTMLNSNLSPKTRSNLLNFFSEYVRGRGLFPTLRIGKLPYGILPVMDYTTEPTVVGVNDTFETGLSKALYGLANDWLAMAKNSAQVPRIGGSDSDDPDQELLQILAMEPASTSYRLKTYVDERYMALLMMILRELFFGPDPLGQMEGWNKSKQNLSGQLIDSIKRVYPGLSNAILCQAFGWEEGSENPMNLVISEDSDPEEYLNWDYLSRMSHSPTTLLEFVMWHAVNLKYDDPTIGQKVGSALMDLCTALKKNMLSIADLETHFRDGLDLCTHRLDAWITAVAMKQLVSMRMGSSIREPYEGLDGSASIPIQELQLSKPNQEGIYLGAFGWVENLQAGKFSAGKHDGGYIHAPSLTQAKAAAILRNAYLTYEDNTDGNPFSIYLDSNRVKHALRLIDGVRENQGIDVLLGYQFERGLHDKSLDRYIDDFRKLFPPNGTNPNNRISPRHVVDGRALADSWKLHKNESHEWFDDWAKEKGIQVNRPDDPDLVNLRGLLDELVETLDGVEDLYRAESIFQQMGKDNPVRTGAVADSASGKHKPTEIEFIRTTPNGTDLAHRLCMLMDNRFANNPSDPSNFGPRGRAEPRLANWFSSILGDMKSIEADVVVNDPPEKKPITLDRLEIDPLDFLYISSMPAEKGQSELRLRVASFLGIGKDTSFVIRSEKFKKGLWEAVELARFVMRFLGSCTYLKPEAFCVPEYANEAQFSNDDVKELRQRVDAARQEINTLASSISPNVTFEPEKVRSIFELISRFGVEGSLFPYISDVEIDSRRNKVYKVLIEREANCKTSLDIADSSNDTKEQIDALVKAMKALFGDKFVVLPTLKPPPANDRASWQAMLEEENQRSLLGSLGEQRIRLWLEDCAEVHQGAQNLDDILLANNAWQEIGKNTFRLKVIQLPVLQPWLALSDDEIEGGMTEGEKNQWKIEREKIGRKKGVVSMVALTNDQADLTCLSGLMAEEWSETIPDKELETGISFQYNGPNTQAPQAILLAVPKPNMPLEYWTVDKLVKTLECTMDLMKIRMVDLDAMGTTRNLFPATFLPFDPHRPGWNDAETILPDLKKWIEQLRR